MGSLGRRLIGLLTDRHDRKTGEPHARSRAGEARGRCRAKVFAGFSWFSASRKRYSPGGTYQRDGLLSRIFGGVVSSCWMCRRANGEIAGCKHLPYSLRLDGRTNTAKPSAHQTTAEGRAHQQDQASRIERTTTGLGTSCHPCCTNNSTLQLAGSLELTGII